MNKELLEGRRFVATWEWLEHELSQLFKRFDVELDERTTIGIHIEPEDPGYARVTVFYSRSPEEEKRRQLKSLLRFWDWVRGGAR